MSQLAVLGPAYSLASDAVTKGVAAALDGLRAYRSHSRLLASWHDAFVDAVGGGLQGLLLAIAMHCMQLAGVRVRMRLTLPCLLPPSHWVCLPWRRGRALPLSLALPPRQLLPQPQLGEPLP